MSEPEVASPEERIRAFLVAVDEELVVPTRRYLRGFRRGLLVGCILGMLFAPVAGAESRRRLSGPVSLRRRLRHHRREPAPPAVS